MSSADKLIQALARQSHRLPKLRVFEMSDVAPIPGVTQAAIPRYQTTRLPSDVQLGFPGRRRAVLGDVMRGIEADAHRWYHAEPVRQEFIRELGEDAGNEGYNFFADMVAGTSSAAPVVPNIRKASWYRQQALEGLLPDSIDSKSAAVEWLRSNPPPAGYGSVAQNNDAMWSSRFLSGPQVWRSSEPGASHKIISFGQNLRGNLRPWTGDRHEAARLGVPAVFNSRAQKMEKGMLTPNEYVAAEKMMNRLGSQVGLEPAEVQSARWMGGASRTGVRSGDPSFAHAVETAVLEQAKRTGREPRDVLRDFIRNAGLLSVGAAAAMEGE